MEKNAPRFDVRNNLTRKDIDELYAILERAEEELK